MKTLVIVGAVLLVCIFGTGLGDHLARKDVEMNCSVDTIRECSEDLQLEPIAGLLQMKREEQLDNYCRLYDRFFHCVDQYIQKCFVKEEREAYRDIAGGAISTLNSLCQQGGIWRNRYWQHAACLNTLESVTTPDGVCGKKFGAMQQMASLMRNSSQIPAACCLYDDLMSCYYNHIQERCGVATANFVYEFTQNTESRIIKQQCGRFPECLQREKIIPAEQQTTALPTSNKTGAESENFMTKKKEEADCGVGRIHECTGHLQFEPNAVLFHMGKEEQLNSYCRLYERFRACVEGYVRKCFPKEEQEMLRDFAGGAASTLNSLCLQGGMWRNRYLNQSTCVGKLKNGTSIVGICRKELAAMKQMIAILRHKSNAQEACCLYDNLMSCYFTHVLAKCDSAASIFMYELTQSMEGRVLQQECGRFPECSRRKKIYPAGQQTTALPTSSTTVPSPPAALDCLQSGRVKTCLAIVASLSNNALYFAHNPHQMNLICRASNCLQRHLRDCPVGDSVIAEPTLSYLLWFTNFRQGRSCYDPFFRNEILEDGECLQDYNHSGLNYICMSEITAFDAAFRKGTKQQQCCSSYKALDCQLDIFQYFCGQSAAGRMIGLAQYVYKTENCSDTLQCSSKWLSNMRTSTTTQKEKLDGSSVPCTPRFCVAMSQRLQLVEESLQLLQTGNPGSNTGSNTAAEYAMKEAQNALFAADEAGQTARQALGTATTTKSMYQRLTTLLQEEKSRTDALEKKLLTSAQMNHDLEDLLKTMETTLSVVRNRTLQLDGRIRVLEGKLKNMKEAEG